MGNEVKRVHLYQLQIATIGNGWEMENEMVVKESSCMAEITIN